MMDWDERVGQLLRQYPQLCERDVRNVIQIQDSFHSDHPAWPRVGGALRTRRIDAAYHRVRQRQQSNS